MADEPPRAYKLIVDPSAIWKWRISSWSILYAGPPIRTSSSATYEMGLVCITSWYPNFNRSHFGLPPSEIHRMTGLPPKIVWTVTYSHRPHRLLRSSKLQHATSACSFGLQLFCVTGCVYHGDGSCAWKQVQVAGAPADCGLMCDHSTSIIAGPCSLPQ